MNSAYFRVLGPVQLELGGQPISIGGLRQVKILALLAVHANTIVPREKLIELLWEEPPKSANQQVFNVVSALRRLLAAAESDTAILTESVGYRLATPTDTVDLARFEERLSRAGGLRDANRPREAMDALSEALDLWSGPALAGLAGERLERIAARLNEDRLRAIEKLVEARVSLGQGGDLIGELIALVAEHPLREALRVSLMTALHLSGRQGDALAVYDEGRHILREEFGLDPGPALQAAHHLVLTEDPAHPRPCVSLDASGDAAQPDPAVRSNLPMNPNCFVGRDHELRILAESIGSRSAVSSHVISIGGMGGVGKTALAVRVAHGVAERFPGGQYFIDLQGFSSSEPPVRTSDALVSLLRLSGVPAEEIPVGLEERVLLWRSRLAEGEALVILDNAVDDAQIAPLLPGAGAHLVIVTSRRRLGILESNLSIGLEPIGLEASRLLFEQTVGVERVRDHPESVADVVRSCGQLPLVIKLAAALLRDRRAWTVDHLAEVLSRPTMRRRLLRTAQHELDDIASPSFTHLSPPQQHLLRSLGQASEVCFDAPSAAALAELPVEEVEWRLESLVDDNLLMQRSIGRYELHDLVKDYAMSLARNA